MTFAVMLAAMGCFSLPALASDDFCVTDAMSLTLPVGEEVRNVFSVLVASALVFPEPEEASLSFSVPVETSLPFSLGDGSLGAFSDPAQASQSFSLSCRFPQQQPLTSPSLSSLSVHVSRAG
jgi:hypothetical protein